MSGAHCPQVLYLVIRHSWFESGIDIKLADIGRDVEEKRKPADPVEELDLADLGRLRREAFHRHVDMSEEGEQSTVFVFSFLGRIELWVSFFDRKNTDKDSRGEGD